MKTMIFLQLDCKPGEVWKRGLKYAQQYSAELVALFLIEKENDLLRAQELLTNLLEQAAQAGITAGSEIVVRHENFDIFAYKNKHDARLLIM